MKGVNEIHQDDIVDERNPVINTWDIKSPVDNGIRYQAELVQDF